MADSSHPPRIGVVADPRSASFGPWQDIDVNLIWAGYVQGIDDGGGVAVLFPPTERIASDPALALDAIDGLLLNGGPDIVASTYGAEPDPHSEPGSELRDRVEVALAIAAIERDLPVLGVCRGLQVLNIALGGGIDQHLADEQAIHRGARTSFSSHPVQAVPGSRLAGVIGTDAVDVRSYHHQGLEPTAARLTPAATAPDGLLEAAEVEDSSFCVGVLWHPEQDLAGGGQALFSALVDAAVHHAEGAAV